MTHHNLDRLKAMITRVSKIRMFLQLDELALVAPYFIEGTIDSRSDPIEG